VERTKSSVRVEMTRLQNQQQQVERIQDRRRNQPIGANATQVERSRASGFRLMQGSDGGVFYSRWLANSAPGGKTPSVTINIKTRSVGSAVSSQQKSV
jgi:hypothetical protein